MILYVIDLGEVKPNSMVGGKASNLALLISAGFNVPEGVVITNSAFIDCLKYNNVELEIKELISELDSQNNVHEGVARQIRNIIISMVIPSNIMGGVSDYIKKKGDHMFAVRSSSDVEDSNCTSAAGQFDSFINVNGLDKIQQSIKLCWASLWNERAIAYRKMNNIFKDELKFSVIIQRMVNPKISGAIFTLNPVTNIENQMIIECIPGLSEKFMSGRVTPNHWLIDVKNKIILKELKPNNQLGMKLKLLEQLMEVAISIKNFFGCHQDIEWAWDGDEVFILQSRPITTKEGKNSN